MSEPSIFGYFTAADQRSPEYDPHLGVPCPICLRQLNLPVKTISLMRDGDSRSYFFRAHKQCWETAPDRERIEHSLIDAISAD